MTKRQGKNLNILRTKRAVKMKLKTFFIIFKEFSAARNRFGPNSGPLRRKNISYAIFNQFKQVFFIHLLRSLIALQTLTKKLIKQLEEDQKFNKRIFCVDVLKSLTSEKHFLQTISQ